MVMSFDMAPSFMASFFIASWATAKPALIESAVLNKMAAIFMSGTPGWMELFRTLAPDAGGVACRLDRSAVRMVERTSTDLTEPSPFGEDAEITRQPRTPS